MSKGCVMHLPAVERSAICLVVTGVIHFALSAKVVLRLDIEACQNS